MNSLILAMISLFIVACSTPTGVATNACEPHTTDAFNCVQYISNYDGDTVKFKIPGTHPLLGENISIRVNGIDTPEMRTKDKCEKKKAKQAKLLVEKVLTQARRIDLRNISRGKYFRIVADVYADNINIAPLLIQKNLAYKYDGGRKPSSNWCD